MAIHLGTSLKELPGIGPKAFFDFQQMGIFSVRDLLLHIPYRYDDFSSFKPIPNLKHNDTVTLEATIKKIQSRRSQNKRVMLTEAIVENKTGELQIVWFNQIYVEKRLHSGTSWAFAGRIDRKFGKTSLMNPVYEPIGKQVNTGRLLPVYHVSGSLSVKRVREFVHSCLSATNECIDWIPLHIQEQENLCSFSKALEGLHRPSSWLDIRKGRERLAFEEHFLRQLLFACVREEQKNKKAHSFSINKDLLKTFVQQLPFALTTDQRKAAWEIIQDLQKERPMNRLLQGDVGSGKTVVAALAALGVLQEKKQVVYLAPTELLAKQQHQVFCEFFPDQEIGLFTRSFFYLSARQSNKQELLKKFKNNSLFCVVGTHALLEESVCFANMAFIIIDEQHRFGVEQRHALLEQKKFAPHLLSMTATPIPRSLALSFYGDLAISSLHELPKGRKPITTTIIFPAKEATMYEHILKEIQQKHRIFVVCPAIDSDMFGQTTVQETAQRLGKGPLKGVAFGTLHGKMKAKEKEEVMSQFVQGKIDVLICTTVVEVGVDVPQATVMVIMGAERFGLAQLHQLRGRVGRSDRSSSCFLCPNEISPFAKERLQMLVASQDGFALAEKDLQLRGSGNLFGTIQSGFPEWKFADPFDLSQMKKAQHWAKTLLQEDQFGESYPLVKQKITEAFDIIHLE